MPSATNEEASQRATDVNEASRRPLRVLFVTSQWGGKEGVGGAPFIRREVEALRACVLDVDVFAYDGAWSPLVYLRAIRALRRRLRRRSYDVVHARFGQCGLVARAQWRVPVVITYGGSDIQGSLEFSGVRRLRNYLLRFVSWILSLLVDEVIVVSDHLGKMLPRRAYHVIPSGVDFALFQPLDPQAARTQLALPHDKRLVLFAGNPDNKQKRYGLAVRAFERAAASIDAELVVLTGQPSSRVPLFMSACDVLLLTSFNEGSPNVVKEALACNLPVVSVDVGDVRERIGSVAGCVLCDSDEPEVIADALCTVLKQPQRLSSREAIRDLDEKVMAAKVVGVYHRALAKRRAASW